MKSITITNQDTGDSFTIQRLRTEGTLIGELEGFEYPSVIEAIEDVANTGGAVYITSKFGRRRVGITGIITCDRLDERIVLGRSLSQTGSMKLIEFTTLDDRDLQFEAEVVKLINPYTTLEKPFLIELIAPDYRFYSQTLNTFETGETEVGGATAIPTPIPMSLAGGSNPNIVINAGNERSDPIFTINGPGTNFTIYNTTTGQQFDLNLTLIAGEYVTVDVKNRTVIQDGEVSVFNDFDGDFWQLKGGSNIIAFQVQSGATVDTTLEIAYRDAYNGV